MLNESGESPTQKEMIQIGKGGFGTVYLYKDDEKYFIVKNIGYYSFYLKKR